MNIHKLTSIGSPALRGSPPDRQRLEAVFAESAERIDELLRIKNGFYAFESALHVFADLGAPPDRGLYDWNDEAGWRAAYLGMAKEAVFFAEDVFGTQFCIHDGAIATFEPETGAFERMAADMDEWATLILGDYSYWSGHAVGRAWQLLHGPLPIGSRLVPITPFVMGGRYEAANVHAMDAAAGMEYRASIAVQIRDLPDGTSVKIRVE
jgi:hypothetical protein